MALDLAAQYIEAFSKVYSQSTVAVKRKYGRRGEFLGFNVCINGEDGGHRLLTTNEMREAIRDFTR